MISFKKAYSKNRHGCRKVLIYKQGKFSEVSPENELNAYPIASISSVYGTGIMETLTLYKRTDTKLALVLLKQRLERLFNVTLPNSGFDLAIRKNLFKKKLVCYINNSKRDLFLSEDTKKVSVRIHIAQGIGSYGVGTTTDDIALSVELIPIQTKDNFKPQSLMVGKFQRLEPFNGKRSALYSRSVFLKNKITKNSADSVLFFDTFLVKKPTTNIILDRIDDSRLLKSSILNLAIANTMGAEVFGITKNGNLIYPPKYLYRLGGVTLDYVVGKLATELKLKVIEKAFSLSDIISGKIVELCICGNKSEITPISILKFTPDVKLKSIRMKTKLGRRLRNIFLQKITDERIKIDKNLLTIL